jgi:demethylmenaquinone methyltransferase/2-methoxy-6-polyprenyl-1,4-benzoquinol methylase
MLAAARTDAPLVRGDALRLPFPDASFAGATCGFALRNLTSLPEFFAECARVVHPGGRIAFLEVAEPTGRSARFVHGVWFRKVVPAVGGLLSDRAAYSYLPASTTYLPAGDGVLRMMDAAGFVRAERQVLGMGAAQLLTAVRR